MFWDVKAKFDRAQILFILFFFYLGKRVQYIAYYIFFTPHSILPKAIYTIFESITRICFSKV